MASRGAKRKALDMQVECKGEEKANPPVLEELPLELWRRVVSFFPFNALWDLRTPSKALKAVSDKQLYERAVKELPKSWRFFADSQNSMELRTGWSEEHANPEATRQEALAWIKEYAPRSQRVYEEEEALKLLRDKGTILIDDFQVDEAAVANNTRVGGHEVADEWCVEVPICCEPMESRSAWRIFKNHAGRFRFRVPIRRHAN